MDLSADLVYYLTSFMWPFFRIGAMMMTVIVIGTRLVPVRVRLLLSLAITFVVYQHLPAVPVMSGFSFDFLLVVAKEIVIGAALGLTMQLVTQAFIIGGQLIAMQAGLGFASVMDPQSGVAVPSVSQFFFMLVTLLYLAMNGHLLMIEVIIESFTHLPIGEQTLSQNGLWSLVNAANMVFSGGVVMALPAVITLLIVNLSFGVMTKASPQLNIFSVGFPITITLGLFIIWVTLPLILSHFNLMLTKGLDLTTLMMLSRV